MGEIPGVGIVRVIGEIAFTIIFYVNLWLKVRHSIRLNAWGLLHLFEYSIDFSQRAIPEFHYAVNKW